MGECYLLFMNCLVQLFFAKLPCMLMRNFLLIYLFFIALSCQTKEKIIYENLVYTKEAIKMWTDTIDESASSDYQNGKFNVGDSSGRVIASGQFVNGFRSGSWTYEPETGRKILVDWVIHNTPEKKIAVNVPEDWTVLQQKERPLIAVFPTDTAENRKGYYFVVQSFVKDSVKMNVDEYFEYYRTEMFSDSIQAYAFYKFETHSGRSYYFARFIAHRDKDVLILVFLGMHNEKLIDVTYVSSIRDSDRKHIVFFDMIRSLVLDDRRFFSPFDPVRSYRQIGKSERHSAPPTI
jgi:hypothetical protein